MADNLRSAIGELFVELISLIQKLDTNKDEDVKASIASQHAFFTMVQQRAAELGTDVTQAKRRLGTQRYGGWAKALMTQAASDVRDAAMPPTALAEAQTIEDVAKAIEGARDAELPKLP